MPIWRPPHPLLLASRSAARLALLQGAGLPVRAVPAAIDERALELASGLREAGAVASLLAREKAAAVAAKQAQDALVLGADQTLALGDARLSKPASQDEARRQLMALRGKTHTLHSAVAVLRGGEVLFEHRDAARLTMRDFSDDFLDGYLREAGDAALASVGGYQLEGPGIQLFDKVDGDYFTILGLPLLPLLGFLRRSGFMTE